MRVSRAYYVLLLTLISFVGTLLINGCGGTIPAAPHIPGCFTKCRYFENTGPSDAEDCEFRGQNKRVEYFCTSERSCDDIVRNNYQKQICGSQFPTYSDIDWDANTKTCGKPDKPYPESQNSTCLPVDGKICSDPSIPKICICDESIDDDCDGVPNGQDQCREELDPLRLEDPDNWMTDGCADFDNDQDGILDGVDVCANQKCDPAGNPSRCSDPTHPKYGCKSDVDLIPANDFSAKISISYGTEGTENQAIAHFLSFGSGETGYPHYNEATYSIVYGDKVTFAKDLRVRWTVKSINTADALPQLNPLSGETGWDGVSGEPQSMKLKFVDQKTSPRDHPIQYEVSAEILNLDQFVDGVATIKPLTIGQTGADQCVQKGLDGGTVSDYAKCHFEAVNFTTLRFKSDHENAAGDNILRKSGAYLWVVGLPMNTKADPFEYYFDKTRNHPITHSTSTKMVVSLGIAGLSIGDRFTLEGTNAKPYASFAVHATPQVWNGSVEMTASAPMPLELGILDETIDWTIKVYDANNRVVATKTAKSGPHRIYLTYDTPIKGTSAYKDAKWPLPFRELNGKDLEAQIFHAENEVTSDKLNILLAPYSEAKDAWGMMGGLDDVEEIADNVHKFLSFAPIITQPHKTPSCFNSSSTKEYMWSIFSMDYGGARCVERAFLMEIFLKAVGISAEALQLKASNDANIPIQNMVNEPRVVYKSRPTPTPNEWLLMNFTGVPTGLLINEGEGVAKVDLSQGVGTPKIRYYPQALDPVDDEERKLTIGTTPCNTMSKIQDFFEFDFQQWCKRQIVGQEWECSDRLPVPTCPAVP